jgi:arylsulfatase A-like enzyme
MTGKYPQHMGIRGNADPLLPWETTIPEMLKSVDPDYRCATMGKWHSYISNINGDYSVPTYGFDEFYDGSTNFNVLTQEWTDPKGNLRLISKMWEHFGQLGWECDSKNHLKGMGEIYPQNPNDPDPNNNNEFMTDSLTTLAIDFIARSKDDNKPFFLYLPYHAVHTAIDCPLDEADHFADKLGLEAHWKFDTDLGSKGSSFTPPVAQKAYNWDSSGSDNSYTEKLNGGTISYNSGKVERLLSSASTYSGYNRRQAGEAVVLDSNSYLIADGGADPNKSYSGVTEANPRTVSVWVEPDVVGGTVITWGEGGSNTLWQLSINSQGYAQLDLGAVAGSISGSINLCGNWHHIAATYDGSTAKLYVDKKSVGQLNVTLSTSANSNVVMGQSYDGKLDDVRIYNQAMTEKQISDIYHQRLHDNMYYAGMIRRLDKNIGRILDRLEDPNGDGNKSDSIEENTAIIFFSDNGARNWVHSDSDQLIGLGDPQDPYSDTYYDYPTSNYPLTSTKHYVYEGGIRVPLIIKWPGVTNSNSVSTVPVSAIDFLPTIYEMVYGEGAMMHSGLSGIDGKSLVPLLKNPDRTPSEFKRNLFSQDRDGNVAVICNDGQGYDGYKLVERTHVYNTDNELYNLNENIIEDPNHSHDSNNNNYDPDDPNSNDHNDLAYSSDPNDIAAMDHLADILLEFKYQMPLLHFKFDEEFGNTAYDSGMVFGSPNKTGISYARNDGELNDFPTDNSQWVPGKIDNALSFDGLNDYAEAPYVLDPNDGSFSAFAWIRTDAATGTIMTQLDGAGTGRVWLNAYSGKFCTMLQNVSGGLFADDPNDPSINDGQWHHVGIVWDYNSVTETGKRYLYVDGNMVECDESPIGNLEPSDGDMRFGLNKSGNYYWDGLIDDVRVYDRALDPNEILEFVKVAHWKFDEPEQSYELFAEDSSNGYDGMLKGGALRINDPNSVSRCLDFDGLDDYAELPFVLDPNKSSFSAFAWIKTSQSMGVVLTQLDGTGSAGRIWLNNNDDGKFSTVLQQVDGWSPLVSDFTLTDGAWHHVGVVWNYDPNTNTGKRFLYADGSLVDEDANSIGNLESSDGKMYIGAHKYKDTTNPDQYFKGLIDDVQIFTKPLSIADVNELYSQGTSVTLSDLIGSWDFEESKYNGSLEDNSGNGKHGVLKNYPVWYSDDPNGLSGGCLSFDGLDDYVEVPFVLDPNDGTFSAFAWVKGGGGTQNIICQTDDSFGNIGRIWVNVTSTGDLATQLRPSDGSLGGLIYDIPTSWDTSAWHHVGVVWDGNRRHLYLDGIEVEKDENPISNLESVNSGLYIGAHKYRETTHSDAHWDGLIDDVRIYRRALSTDEISDLASVGQ